jgi:hypothetical protein
VFEFLLSRKNLDLLLRKEGVKFDCE